MLRANHVSAPPTICPKLLIERSVMWLSGRKDRKRSSGRRSINDVRLRIVAITLAWVIIVPFGGPVVPLVYTRVARSVGLTSLTSSSSPPVADSPVDAPTRGGRRGT